MTIEVDQIVREVIAEIERPRGDNAAARDDSPATPTATDRAASGNDSRELAVCSRVVTMADVGDRLGGIRRLVVPPGAVITPALRDALADRGITVTHQATTQQASAAAAKLMLVAVMTPFKATQLADTLRAAGVDIEAQMSDCLIRSTDALAERVRDGRTLGLVLTPHVAAALCLANRHAGVRAVSATDASTVAQAARAVGANVLVVNPQGKGIYQLKQAIGAFCRFGPWACPEALRPRLA